MAGKGRAKLRCVRVGIEVEGETRVGSGHCSEGRNTRGVDTTFY